MSQVAMVAEVNPSLQVTDLVEVVDAFHLELAVLQEELAVRERVVFVEIDTFPVPQHILQWIRPTYRDFFEEKNKEKHGGDHNDNSSVCFLVIHRENHEQNENYELELALLQRDHENHNALL